MSYCRKCGTKLSDGARFCSKCGTRADQTIDSYSTNAKMKKSGKMAKGNIIKWILAVFMFSGCLVYGFSLASIIFALLGVFLLPIAPIQNLIDKVIPKKKFLRGIIAIILFAVGCSVAPKIETTSPEATNPTSITISTETISDSTTDVTSDTASAPSTETVSDSITDTTHNTTTAPTTETTTPATQSPTETFTEPPVAPENSTFEIHFIDVGQADAALVLCDGKAMLIDGGNVEDSSLLYTYLKKNDVSHLDYVIGTHAHEDHIGGLAGALNYATVDVAYCPTTSYDTKAFSNFVKALDKHSVSITVPSTGDFFNLGSAICSVLAVNTDNSEPNNTSIVLRIIYGDTSFLFTGDAEREVEQAILNRGTNINSTVLKVGHHGSESSTSYVWLREIMPQYAVISVGTGNSYGHPTEDVLSRLRDAEVTTFRTDLQGDIICVSDGNAVTFTVARNANVDVFGGIGENSTQQTNPPENNPPETNAPETNSPETTPPETAPPVDNGQDYVVNTNTDKFHYPSCHSAAQIKKSNRWDYYGTRDELINMGYVPCKNCNP